VACASTCSSGRDDLETGGAVGAEGEDKWRETITSQRYSINNNHYYSVSSRTIESTLSIQNWHMKKLTFTEHGISRNPGFSIQFNQNYRSIYQSYARWLIASIITKDI
jgi:hypothetical protein